LGVRVRITVRAKPGAKHASIRMLSDTEYEIAIIERPEKGRATAAVRKALADHLGISQSRLSLIMGASSRTKVFDVQ
jgi:uncharacterized protein YggU (UPF0235/DUF167 family)